MMLERRLLDQWHELRRDQHRTDMTIGNR
jgi:hypothetical protein